MGANDLWLNDRKEGKNNVPSNNFVNLNGRIRSLDRLNKVKIDYISSF